MGQQIKVDDLKAEFEREDKWLEILLCVLFPVGKHAIARMMKMHGKCERRLQPIGVYMIKGTCDGEVCINVLLLFIGLASCHAVHILLRSVRH